MFSRGNWSNAAARARSRRGRLLDRTRIRQLIKQQPDAIAASIGDAGYRQDIDLYAHRLDGAELVEAGLSHNLDREVHQVLKFCQGELSDIVGVWATKIDYNKAKSVLRAVDRGIETERISHSALPKENPENAEWIAIVDSSSTLEEAAASISRTGLGRGVFRDMGPEDTLADYEDALDRSYYLSALSVIPNRGPNSPLRKYLKMEIAHRDVLNILRAIRQGISSEKRAAIFLPGSGLSRATEAALIQANSLDDVLQAVRRTLSFDDSGLQEALQTYSETRTMDSVVDLFHHKRSELLLRFSHLHPISAMPIVYYIERKLLEVENLRLLVRGKAAGLPEPVIEAHLTL
ncbi:MAG: hypothetical protein CMB13_05235 [Euryarchaeota archaeon]|nr:hypothetical protein [Euryarchaeota archaeon]